jgi:hypothetical protein
MEQRPGARVAVPGPAPAATDNDELPCGHLGLEAVPVELDALQEPRALPTGLRDEVGQDAHGAPQRGLGEEVRAEHVPNAARVRREDALHVHIVSVAITNDQHLGEVEDVSDRRQRVVVELPRSLRRQPNRRGFHVFERLPQLQQAFGVQRPLQVPRNLYA